MPSLIQIGGVEYNVISCPIVKIESKPQLENGFYFFQGEDDNIYKVHMSTVDIEVADYFEHTTNSGEVVMLFLHDPDLGKTPKELFELHEEEKRMILSCLSKDPSLDKPSQANLKLSEPNQEPIENLESIQTNQEHNEENLEHNEAKEDNNEENLDPNQGKETCQ